VGAQLQAHDAVGLTGSGGEEDHGDLGQIGIAANAFADVETVGIGEHDVEQDEIGSDLAAEVNGAAAGLKTGQGEAFFFPPSFSVLYLSRAKRSTSSWMSRIFFISTQGNGRALRDG